MSSEPEAGRPSVRSSEESGREEGDETPGVPGFHTWRGVYLFVFIAFVLVVVALAIFSRVFA